ncbi:14367_t:CDS:2, partial [Racocetra fulgida]
MTTTQRGKSMNNLMKGYIDVTTSLSTFLKAFKSALNQRKENLKFLKYCESVISVQLVTKSLVKKQAMQLLTQYALKKTQTQLLETKTFYNSFNELVQKELTVNTFEQAFSSNKIMNPISVKQK